MTSLDSCLACCRGRFCSTQCCPETRHLFMFYVGFCTSLALPLPYCNLIIGSVWQMSFTPPESSLKPSFGHVLFWWRHLKFIFILFNLTVCYIVLPTFALVEIHKEWHTVFHLGLKKGLREIKLPSAAFYRFVSMWCCRRRPEIIFCCLLAHNEQ